jgi:hypothetical protein
MEDDMSDIPGINPFTSEIEDTKHSDDPTYNDARDPDKGSETSEDSADETKERKIARIECETIDLA